MFLLLHYLCLYTLKFPLGERLPVLTWDSRVSFPRAKTPSVAPHILDNGNRVPSLPGRSERFRGKGLPLEGGGVSVGAQPPDGSPLGCFFA